MLDPIDSASPSPVLSMNCPDALDGAAAAMREGAAAAFPTDTVYGLGTGIFRRDGIARLFALKRRSAEKALPVLLADASDLALVVEEVPHQAHSLVAWFWPGPLTLILPRHRDVPAEIAPGRSSIGVRVPDHALTRDLIRLVGTPLATSSANLSEAPPATDANAVLQAFPTGLAAILDGGVTTGGVASTVLDLTNPDRPTVLREGPISRWALEDVLAQWVY